MNAVRFLDNSNSLIVSGSDDGLVLVWDRRSLKECDPKPVGIFAGHTSGITFVHSRVKRQRTRKFFEFCVLFFFR